MFLSIIVPVHNEADRIASTLRRILTYCAGKEIDFEVIVVDDGSSDETSRIVEKHFGSERLILVRNGTNRGKGYSVRRGMLLAKGDFILFTDADLSAPIEEADKLLEWIESGYDVAIGSRAVSDVGAGATKVLQPLPRWIMSRIFNSMVRLFVTGEIQDTQCGFKCFTKTAARDIFRRQRLDGFSFDVEVIYLAEKLGYRVKEVPVNWLNSSRSAVNVIRDSWKMVCDIVKIKKLHDG